MITIHGPQPGLSTTIAPILRALPQWFGIEEATQMYIHEAGQHPTFIAQDDQQAGQTVGFLTLVRHSPYSAEIYVMAVLPDYHRRGVGRALNAAVEAHLRAEGVMFVQVKTLSNKHPDEGYRKTRAFYEAMGYRLLEEFPDLWGPHNPCWQLVKAL